MAEYYIARHFDELTKVFELLKNTWDWSKPLKIEWKASRKIRSLPQNSLFHVWCGEFATYLTQLSYMAPHPEFGPQMFQLEDVKTMAKREWGVIEKKYDPIKGKMVPYLKSTTQYTSGEMFFCMQGLQAYAGGLGCILESTGEYLELLREADGRP